MGKSWGKPSVFRNDRDPMFRNGLVMVEGNDWVCHRHLIAPAFSPLNLKWVAHCTRQLGMEQRFKMKAGVDFIFSHSVLPPGSSSKSINQSLVNFRSRFHAKVGDRWEICVNLSDGQFQQGSSVNSIDTIKGGTYVDYVTNQITTYVMNKVNKKKKDANVRAHTVKNRLWVFSQCSYPAFDSQTKETLTTIQNLKETDGTKNQRVRGIVKLEDANDAGGKNSDKCTLILTKGDSAKRLLQLLGCLLWVETIMVSFHRGENCSMYGKPAVNRSWRMKKFKILKRFLDFGRIRSTTLSPSFLVEFTTPIIKAFHSNGTKLSFYSMPNFESWKESLGNNANGWKIKYNKGLGTSSPQEGREYFRDLVKHKKDFVWEDDHDGDAIELAFSKKKAEDRKNWIRGFEKKLFKEIKVGQFVGYVSEQSADHHET
ncbi:hypothetical protein L6164_006193 [Bauhinia variegata]|uniref:Uncharacterized protein n=1 Tax=Bauhinia variegata TaxID=167791 RepID=A0ACB9PVI3_BAUVA|nr:hypothetical protein L6164_006193 [Bauhinia variegata]